MQIRINNNAMGAKEAAHRFSSLFRVARLKKVHPTRWYLRTIMLHLCRREQSRAPFYATSKARRSV